MRGISDRADDPAIDSEVSFTYRATFTPVRAMDSDGGNAVAGLPGDRNANNRATAAVVARGHRRVLFLDDPAFAKANPHKHLLDTLRDAKFRVATAVWSQLPLFVTKAIGPHLISGLA